MGRVPRLADEKADLVSALIVRRAEEPERIAFRFLNDGDDGARSLTYAALDRRARLLGQRLSALGAEGERALIVHPPGLDYVVALFGCWYAGAVAVPSYPPRAGRPNPRLRSIALDSGARFALTTGASLERLEDRFAGTRVDAGPLGGPDLAWIATDADEGAEPPGSSLFPARDPGAVALLQYTSGSTSAPKGVALSHAHFIHNIQAIGDRSEVSRKDRVVSWLPPYHDMGLVMGILLPVFAGIEAILLSPSAFVQRPHRWLQAMSQYRATASGAPNFAYELCVRRVTGAQRTGLDLSAWRSACVGAERVRGETLERFAHAFAPVGFKRAAFRPCYGLAEATLCVSLNAPGVSVAAQVVDPGELARGRVLPAQSDRPALTVVSCGKPLAGCDVVVVDPETGRRTQEGGVGEIWVRSPSVGLGYWGQSAEQGNRVFRASFAGESGEANASPGYLRTGDLGYFSAGELYVTGRLKDLLILAGLNHHPEDIEATVEPRHPALRVAGGAAFSVEVAGEERLVIVHEVASPRDFAAAEIAEAIRDAVAEVHELAVHEVVLVAPGAVPKTSSGKVQRGVCRSLYLSGGLALLAQVPLAAPGLPSSVSSSSAPTASPELVDRVRAIMAELLGIETRAEDDFFGLGGDSLTATRLVSRIREQLAVELPLRVVFEARTPAALASRLLTSPKCEEPAAAMTPVDREGKIALSFSQERMWFLHQLDPASAAYNVAGAMVLEGPLDVALLERAFGEVASRHEVLRSNYVTVDGEPQIRITSSLRLGFHPMDLSAESDPEGRASALASALAGAPFDIARDALVRVAIYRIATDRYVFAASMHHLVTDAWSMGVLLGEVCAFYDAFVTGAATPVARNDVSYFDYAAWQRRQFAPERLSGDLAYWKRTLAKLEPLELPSDRPRPARRSAKGGFEPLGLSSQLLRQVKGLGAASGATPFMVLLAAFDVLLHRYTGQSDFAVGVPVANRNRLASEGLVGTLVNTLPVRVAFGPDLSFTELLLRVRDAALGAYTHQDLPFERMVAAVPVTRRAGESPLIQVMFDYQNAPTSAARAGGLAIRPLMLSRGASQFDLSLVIHDTELGHMAGVEYAAELFDPATIRRLLGHFIAILESATAFPSCRISEIPLLTGPERTELLSWANASFAAPPASLAVPALFAQRVAATPDAIAVQDESGGLSYRELDARAEALAARLRSRGAGPGVRVAVLLERSCELVVTLLAAMKTGAAYVPVDPRYPAARVAFVLDDAAAPILVTQPSLEPLVPPDCAAAVVFAGGDRGPAAGESQLEVLPQVLSRVTDLRLPAYVLYTSGSTGKPKGVVISAGALSNFLRSMAHTPGLGAGDRLLSVTTIAFDIAGLELWLPLVTGASVYIAPSDVAADGRALRRLIERVGPTVMQATPATWRMLIEAGWQGDPRLKVLCGGEAFPRDLAGELLARSESVWNMYGPTETTIWSTVQRVQPGAGPVPIGLPVDRTRIYVLDPSRALVPVGVPGEIYIGGDGVADGYFERPELTRERFVPDPLSPETGAIIYRTGDRGRLLPGGVLEHLGRLDHQIKLRGFRIEPGEIEAAIQESGIAREAVVVAREERPGEPRLVAYYVPSPGDRSLAGDDAGALREALRARLPMYMVPSAFVAVREIPRTPNGKVDRAALPAPSLADGEVVRPRDELETALVQTWAEILGVTGLGVRDDFFAQGGDSLLALRLLARIEREYAVDVPLVTLLEGPTIELMAQRIRAERRRGTGAAAPRPFAHLVPIQTGRSGPPLVCVHGAGGNVLNMRAIARHVGSDRPFYGVQARGVDGVSEPYAHIEEMAREYVKELRLLEPRGPYFLSGYCGGGLVAFEMATVLQKLGERVALLALIDTYRPGSVPEPGRLQRLLGVASCKGMHGLAERARIWAKRESEATLREAAIAYHRLRREAIPHELRDFWLTRSFLRSAAGYRPGVFRGRLTVLRASELDPMLSGATRELGWSGFASEGVDVYEIQGSHDTMGHEPHVAVLGATLGTRFSAAMAAQNRS